LQDYFAQAGAVTSVNLVLGKITGKSRGFAFVGFADAEAAQRAIDQFHNQEFQGRPLAINVAPPVRTGLRVGETTARNSLANERTALISSGCFRTDRTFSFTGFLNKGLTPAGSRLS
jgi:RNA recognition motif-containing protein